MKHVKGVGGFVRAIYELAQEAGQEEVYFSQLEELSSSITPELLSFAKHPAFSDEEKREVFLEVAKSLKLGQHITAFFILLALYGRLDALPNINDRYRRRLLTKQGKQLVQIRSAQQLSDADEKEISKTFAALLGGELEFESSIDEALLGGVVVQVGSKVFDGSVRGRMNRLKESLMRS